MKICFITAGPIEWGSSRMRAYWVAEALARLPNDYNPHNVSVFTLDQVIYKGFTFASDIDVFIWQKAANLERIEQLNGRHYLDVCDPSWWWQPNECREIADQMTGVVASSKALANDFNEWHGQPLATCIPDRLDLSHFTKQRKHTAVNPVRLIWFGVAVNRIALGGTVANLERLTANGYNIELTIMDDRPDTSLLGVASMPIYYIPWSLKSEADVLANHDIALLPPYPGPWGRVKSENKMITAFACGLPVTNGMEYDQLRVLVEDADERKWQGIAGRMTVENDYTVDKSAAEWEALLT